LASSDKPLTKVTLETFLRWKERKVVIDIVTIVTSDHWQLKEKHDKEAADFAKRKEAFKAGKTLGVSICVVNSSNMALRSLLFLNCILNAVVC